MNGMKKAAIFLLLLVSVFTIPGFTESQILFYSQSPSVTRDYLHQLLRLHPAHHSILPLNGEYILKDVEKNQTLTTLTVPSVYHRERSFLFERKFSAPEEPSERYLLRFTALNGRCEVRVNGYLLFRGTHNFLPLSLPLPGRLLKKSDNLLQITVNPWSSRNARLPDWLPVNLPRIDNGIAGPVFLESLPAVSISSVEIEPHTSGDSTILFVRARLTSSRPISGEFDIHTELFSNRQPIGERSFRITAGNRRNVETVELRVNAPALTPWAPEDPSLYALKITLRQEEKIVDSRQKNFFLRTISRQGQSVLLNDSLVFINGINYVYQNPRGNGLVDRKLLVRDLQRIKERGFNAVRIGYFPLSPLFYHITDSLGIFCFQDLPFFLVDEGVLTDSLRREELHRYFRTFLDIAGQHPSLIGIGLGSFSNGKILQRGSFPILRKEDEKPGHRFLFYFNSPHIQVLDAHPDLLSFFEVMERNRQEPYLSSLRERLPADRPVFFSALSKAISYRVDSSAITRDLHQIIELNSRLDAKKWQNRLGGRFIFTYSDFYLQTPSLQAGPKHRFLINTVGLYTLNRQLKKEAKGAFGNRAWVAETAPLSNEKRSLRTGVFTLLGLINFLIFLVVYRSLLDFRRNVHRSVRRPHGFFSDLQERRLITYGQSFFLMLIVSVNGAVMFGSLLYFFRNNFYMDYLLSLLFWQPQVKLWVSRLIWKPIFSVPFLTLLNMLLMVLLAVPIRVTSFFREPRVRTRQAIAVVSWAGAPFVILLPLGMFFYNLLIVLNSYWILLSILLYFHVWYVLRWINGTRVMLELPYARVFLFSAVLALLILTGVFFYLNDLIYLSGHIKFLFLLFQSLI